MKIIFLGKHIGDNNNCLGLDALKYLYITKQLKNIKCVVKEKDLLYNYCIKNNIEVTHNIKNYTNTDLIISYGWHKLIPKNIIESSRIGCINFHPAPLPEWRGMGGVFNFALFKEITEWGVSAHFVDENFDTGDIIKTNKFKINPTKETIYSLTKKIFCILIFILSLSIDSSVFFISSIVATFLLPGPFITGIIYFASSAALVLLTLRPLAAFFFGCTVLVIHALNGYES